MKPTLSADRRYSSVLSMLLGAGIVAMCWSFSLACEWYYGTGLSGRRIEVLGDAESYLTRLTHHKDTTAGWQKRADEMAKKLQSSQDYRDRSDYAAMLMHLGGAAKSVEILSEIEASHPGEYVTAANLGTAYELSGNNEKALEWIQEGIKRNKDSHFGTEWLHVKILEAKIALAKDPQWLKTHSVLGLNFGSGTVPEEPKDVSDFGGGKKTLKEASWDVYYQLHERIGFVPAPDPVVADLLFDLGNMAVFALSLEHAEEVYGLALTYKPVNEELVRARQAHCIAVIDSREKAEKSKAPIAVSPSETGSPATAATVVVAPAESNKTMPKVALSVIAMLLAAAIGAIVYKDRKRSAGYRARHTRV